MISLFFLFMFRIVTTNEASKDVITNRQYLIVVPTSLRNISTSKLNLICYGPNETTPTFTSNDACSNSTSGYDNDLNDYCTSGGRHHCCRVIHHPFQRHSTNCFKHAGSNETIGVLIEDRLVFDGDLTNKSMVTCYEKSGSNVGASGNEEFHLLMLFYVNKSRLLTTAETLYNMVTYDLSGVRRESTSVECNGSVLQITATEERGSGLSRDRDRPRHLPFLQFWSALFLILTLATTCSFVISMLKWNYNYSKGARRSRVSAPTAIGMKTLSRRVKSLNSSSRGKILTPDTYNTWYDSTPGTAGRSEIVAIKLNDSVITPLPS